MEYPQLDLENAKGPKALIQTNHGDIKIQLFEKEAPMTVENFVRLAKKGYSGPNTNGSQFFIVQNKNVPKRMIKEMDAAGYPKELVKAYKQGGTPWLDGRHTVFGQVIKGMDVVDEIAKVPRDKANDKPKENVIIKSIHIED